jgi:hypothetical protein
MANPTNADQWTLEHPAVSAALDSMQSELSEAHAIVELAVLGLVGEVDTGTAELAKYHLALRRAANVIAEVTEHMETMQLQKLAAKFRERDAEERLLKRQLASGDSEADEGQPPESTSVN